MLSHVSPENNPAMVDVGDKIATKRTALAMAKVQLNKELVSLFKGNDIQSKKGPVFQTAIIAGTMATKRTSDLIPLCHPIGLENCKISIELKEDTCEAIISCFVSVTHKTGVEMEALTGASVTALTIYDMCKAVSHDLVIKEIKLIEKKGGKSDYFSS